MPKKEEIAKQVKNMREIGMTEEEIADILKADYAIDHGEPLFELPDDRKAGAKKARQAERKAPTTPVKREKKINNEKLFIIDLLTKALAEYADGDFDITNPEREFGFTRNGTRYRITLAMPRK